MLKDLTQNYHFPHAFSLLRTVPLHLPLHDLRPPSPPRVLEHTQYCGVYCSKAPEFICPVRVMVCVIVDVIFVVGEETEAENKEEPITAQTAVKNASSTAKLCSR
ncbi:hypothetical protein CVT25_008891 [Psilocybe cyanescens]|uniref:Uncharacterized protein n=1 Tax=Psilocybe cyanescens TaxID=93625 RepID=A0A409XNI9_PSICY|nr:hypothetical protein CVT25_008891 [Psilocybe cyanescens]